jgi:hypothetical protein
VACGCLIPTAAPAFAADSSGGAAVATPASHSARSGHLRLRSDGTAVAPSNAPASIKHLVAAGNRIAHKPYKWGGGHGSYHDSGYDCSGSVSYALHYGGLLSSPRDSTGFESYGSRGSGSWITIYANGGHVWMTVGGLRFDTSGASAHGSRWQTARRSSGGYVVRHPRGL